MKNFNRGNNSRGRNNRDDRQMYEATCSDCGRDCEVPFRPTGNRPVFCNHCFDRGDSDFGGDRGGRNDRHDRGGRNDRGDRRDGPTMHRATCADCGRSCEVPFKPTAGKPVYCKSCFDNEGSHDKRDNSGKANKSDQSGKKHDEINAKLDKILSLLQNMKPVTKTNEVEAPKEEAKKAKKEKKVTPITEEPKKKSAKAPAKKAPAKKTPTKKAVKKAPAKKK